jgi:adenylate cyclase
MDDLLEGLEGEERAARERLLRRLREEGFAEDVIRNTAAQGMLAFLLAEREVTGPVTLSQREVAQRSGLPLDVLRELRRSQGLSAPDPDLPLFGDGDLELATTMKGLLDAGVPLERLTEIGRLIGRGLAPIAEMMRATAIEQGFDPTLPEDELAEAFRQRSAVLTPFVAPSLVGAMRVQLRSMVANEVAAVVEARGGLAGTRPVAVAFVDLTGFTRLGEELGPHEITQVATRLGAALTTCAEEGVRVVKELGDGAMLVCPEPAPLVRTGLALLDADEELPPVKVGVALGEAVPRAGDWFGRPVNLASRVCGAARPGSVLATRDVRDAVEEVRWSSAGAKHLRGVPGAVPLYRARPAEAD